MGVPSKRILALKNTPEHKSPGVFLFYADFLSRIDNIRILDSVHLSKILVGRAVFFRNAGKRIAGFDGVCNLYGGLNLTVY